MGSGCFEGRVGQRICISFGLFLVSDKCNGLGSDGGRFGLEVNPPDPSVGEPQLVRRTGPRIDGYGIAGKGRADRDGLLSTAFPTASALTDAAGRPTLQWRSRSELPIGLRQADDVSATVRRRPQSPGGGTMTW